MQFLKTAFLILSATSAVSAEFAPRITNFNAGASVKNINIFQRNPSHNMFQNLQTAGRRLEAHSAGFSPECAEACSGAADLIVLYKKEENQEAMMKGDMTWMCPMMDAYKCMASAKPCQDGDEDAEEDGEGEMENMECLCACPDANKIEKMKPEDYCEAGNPMECFATKTECSALFKKENPSKADYDEGMSIHCAMIENDCEKKGTAMMTCAADELDTWGEKGCDAAAYDGKLDTSENKDACCTAGKKIVTCYDGDCVKLSMRYSILKAKDATAEEKKETEKELNKNYHIAKACPDAGMAASEADLKPPATATASADGAWMSLPHAIPFVAMLSALYA